MIVDKVWGRVFVLSRKFFTFLSVGLFLLPVYSSKNSDQVLFVDQTNTILTEARQMTFEGPRSGEGYFSADGQKMIFQSEREPGNPFYQMYVLDLMTGKTQRLSTGQGQTTCGWIHPDMKKALWSSTHLDPKNQEKVTAEFEKRKNPIKSKYSWSFDDQFSIFSSDLQGKNLKQLTHEKGYNAEGSYSPDGKHIAFASNRQAYTKTLNEEEQKYLLRDASYFMDIYIMDADGKNVRQLTHTPGYDGGPFFSADGKKITWRRFTPDGTKAEIYTMNSDGTDQKQVTFLGSMSWAPFFHPSGDYIIFASAVLGFANFELFIVDSQGQQKPVRVTFTEGFDGLASFSPDGRKMTWSHRNEKGESQIYLANWDDALARKLLNLPAVVQQTQQLADSSSERTDKNKDKTDLQTTQQTLQQAAELSAPILENDVRQIIQYMASEAMKGRFTGSEEEKKYTEYIAELFKIWGLKPMPGKDFIQTFEFTSGVELSGKNSAGLEGRVKKELSLGQDYQVLSYSQSGEFIEKPIAFVGYGIQAPATADAPAYDSYRDVDVKGKWVVALEGSPLPAAREFKRHMNMVAFSGLQHKISVAKNRGAAGFIVLSESKVGSLKFDGTLAESQIPVLKMSASVFNEMLSKTDVASDVKSYKAVQEKFGTYDNVSGFILPSQYIKAEVHLSAVKSVGRNVIAQLNPTLIKSQKNKSLLIGAHGDHLGLGQTNSSLAQGSQKGLVHYGADDNASGVAGVLELAHYYSQPTQKKKLQRPLVFAVWSGEEIGILGSTAFVKSWENKTPKNNLPTKSFSESFIAGLNMDMIGRLREHLFVQGVGSATGWARLAEKVNIQMAHHTMNQTTAQKDQSAAAAGEGLSAASLSLTQDPYLPTDSMAIYLGGIPSITFFTGAHSEYHTPNDRAETLNYPGLVQNIQVVRLFADEVAQTAPADIEALMQYQKMEGNSGQKLEGRSFKLYLGTIPDYSQEGVKGVKISGTAKDSPAEKAGLKAGDVITEFDTVKIENIYDYVYTLQSVKPNIKTKIRISRQGQNLELDITPLLKE